MQHKKGVISLGLSTLRDKVDKSIDPSLNEMSQKMFMPSFYLPKFFVI